jgi:hypothetical protein
MPEPFPEVLTSTADVPNHDGGWIDQFAQLPASRDPGIEKTRRSVAL